MHEQLIASLRSFARERHQFDWTVEDTEKALHSYLETYALLDGADGDDSREPTGDGESAHFVAGAFVSYLRQGNSKAFEYLETIVKGRHSRDGDLLALIHHERRRSSGRHRYTWTRRFWYLRSDMQVRAEPHLLGRCSISCTRPGADLRCFSHTGDEIRSILIACAYRIEKNQLVYSYGPSIEYFLERGFKASDIRIFVEKLERNLAGLRVKIVDKPPFKADYMVDEQQLAEHIGKYVTYRADNALWRDVGSISSIIRLRGGHDTLRVEDCRAVFVSTNGRTRSRRAGVWAFRRSSSFGFSCAVGSRADEHAVA